MKYGDKLLNKKASPLLKRKEVKFKVEIIENETQLRERLTKPGIILKIKDDSISQFFCHDGRVNGERYRNIAAHKQSSKEEAMTKLTKKQQKLIKKLTIDFN